MPHTRLQRQADILGVFLRKIFFFAAPSFPSRSMFLRRTLWPSSATFWCSPRRREQSPKFCRYVQMTGPSRAGLWRPDRRDRLPGSQSIDSGSPFVLPSRAALRWPYCRERLPVVLPSRVAPGGPTVNSGSPVTGSTRAAAWWPQCWKRIPGSPTIQSGSLGAIPSRALPR